MPFVILPTNSASGGYDITNSLRFNSGSSDNLSRTTGSTGNRKTVTFSGWFKRSSLSGNQMIFSWGGGGLDVVNFFFNGSPETLNFYNYPASLGANFTTNQLFRDVGAWYHIVLAVDTTQATSSNRIKLYVNGSQVTSFSSITYPTLNEDFEWNVSGEPIRIGANYSVGDFFNGYLAETYVIDGQQLTPSSFGETDEDTGIWKPKAFSGTYGTNGFYLQFKNSGSLGTDSSGNGNTFTVNNLTSIDQTTDTPTNNFCTLNPLWNSFNQGTLSEGNTVSTMSSAVYQTNLASFGISKGKWFWELKIAQASDMNFQLYGVSDESTNKGANFIDSVGTTLFNNTNGKIKVDSVEAGSASAVFAVGNIVGIACNMDDKQISIYKNGVSLHSNVAMSTTSNLVFPCHISYNYSTYIFQYNFGNPSYTGGSYTDGAGFGNFSYAVPSGYYALNTKNLANFG